MIEYTATARREGDAWVVQFPGIGATQGADRDDAVRMAHDYIAVLHEIPIEDVTVTITWQEPIDPAAFRTEMVDRVMEIFRRDSGCPSVAVLDQEGPAWREQATEIVDAVSAEWTEQLTDLFVRYDRLRDDLARIYGWAREHLDLDRDASTLDVTEVINRFEADSQAYRSLIESADPDLTAAVARAIALNTHAGSTASGTARAVIQAVFRNYETPYADPDHQGSNLLMLYLELSKDFNRMMEPRCQAFTCDHRATWHGDLGCELCSCPNLMGPA